MKLVRLNVSVSEELRKAIKVEAARRELTMQQFIIELLDAGVDSLMEANHAGVKDPEQDTNSAV